MSEPTLAVQAADAPPRIRYDFLDGMRALAAWYVVFHHASVEILFTSDKAGVAPFVLANSSWFFWERLAVDVFIVLSGFCLMLPVTHQPTWAVSGGFGGFMKRRAVRILPAYYGAVVLALLVTGLVPGLGVARQARWDLTLPAFSMPAIVTHLLLVHNLRNEWILKINYPLWTVATEWQIYFFFPAMAWLMRRLGLVFTVLSGLGLGWLATFQLHMIVPGASAWFLGLFATGMVAAVIAERPADSTDGLPGMRTLALVLVEFMLNLYRREIPTLAPGDAGLIFNDLISGVMAAYLIVYCVRDLRLGQPGVVTGFLSSKPLVKLGHFAYSVYLVHAPVLAVLHSALQTTPLTPTEKLAAMIGGGLPLVGLVAYPFSRLLERPFMVKRLRTPASAASASAPAAA